MRIGLLTSYAEIREEGLLIHSEIPVIHYEDGTIESRSYLIPFVDCNICKNVDGQVMVFDQLGLFKDEENGVHFKPSQEFNNLALVVVRLGGVFKKFTSPNSKVAPFMISKVSFGDDYPEADLYVVVLEADVYHTFSGINEQTGKIQDFHFKFDYKSGSISMY